MFPQKETRKVIKYARLTGTREEKKTQFKAQLDKMEADAQAGKLIQISDLIGNAEDIYLS